MDVVFGRLLLLLLIPDLIIVTGHALYSDVVTRSCLLQMWEDL